MQNKGKNMILEIRIKILFNDDFSINCIIESNGIILNYKLERV